MLILNKIKEWIIINIVSLIGNVGKEVDLKFAPGSGNAVTRFSLAVKRDFVKEGQPDTDWINCVAFGKTGETIAKYVTKGMKIGVVGRIQISKYEKDGEKRTSTDIVVEKFTFCESKKNSEAPAPAANYDFDFDKEFEAADNDIPF